MRYGLSLASAGTYGDARTLAELAELAEASGWDGIFLEDYIIHWQEQITYDPWIALAAIAMRTERIRIGITVTPLSRRRPWKVAREAVTLDHLSQGRLILGVGIGNGSDADFVQFGEVTADQQRAGMVDEALEVITGLWSGQPFGYHGTHYQIQEVTFLPTPMQQPRIPIWIGGGYPLKGPLNRAARWDGSCLYKFKESGPSTDMTPDDIRELRAFVEARRSANVPFDIVVGGRERGADWDQERDYIRSLAEAGATWSGEHLPPNNLETLRAAIERGPLRID
jgi:alkanesulfonate monooxygenase SsuD/methylene tetrahydromethanopterin reductase-like flavin-dependent oxidoreductase (luciferase family)